MNGMHPNHIYNPITMIHNYNMKFKHKHVVASTKTAVVVAILVKLITLEVTVIRQIRYFLQVYIHHI